MPETDVAFAGVARQAELVRAGEVSPRELVELYLERIERLDPRLNAFRVVLPERARAEAEEAERRRASGDDAPLLGVPIAVKDNHDVAGELTTHGTGCVDEPAAQDSELIRRLRAAGAIVIGKTNLPELAFAMFTESATWGVTRNPWDPTGRPADRPAAAAPPSPRASPPPRPHPTAPARSAIRPPTARCSGSSHSEAGCRSTRGSSDWHGMSVNGFLTRTRPRHGAPSRRVTPAADRGRGPPPPQGSFVEAATGPRRESFGSPRRSREPARSRPPMLDPRCRARGRGDRRAPRPRWAIR